VNTEDRLRAAARARAGLVRDIRPLDLPAEEPRRARGAARTWGAWLGPVAAAAVVVAIALTLVLVRQAAVPVTAAAPTASATATAPVVPAASLPLPSAPAAVAAKVPAYYAVISTDTGSDRDFQGNPARDFSIVDDRTGQTVYSIQAPGAGSLDSVSASDDDKTFIFTFNDNSGGLHWTVDKVHLSAHPGGKLTFSLDTIPITGVDNAQHVDAFLDPGGTEFTVLAEQVTGSTVRTTVQSYHGTEPGSGPIRTWATTTPGTALIGFFQMNSAGSVLFSTPDPGLTGAKTPPYNQVRSLDTTSPSGDLLKSSELIFNGPESCAAALVINNGGTAVCGTRPETGGVPLGSACAGGKLRLSAYAFKTGQNAVALASYPQACDAGVAVPLWATTGVKDVVAQFTVTSGGSTRTGLAVAANGKLYGLPLPVTPVTPVTQAAARMTIAF
jgi:hypothetical protein